MTAPMGTPLNDETRMLFRLLADGQWKRYDVVKDAIAKTIPPGRALRKYEDRLESSRAYRKPEAVKEIGENEKILYGGRACAQITISSWKERKAILARSEAGTKWIKMKPGFEPWKLDPAIPEPQAPKAPVAAAGSTEVPPKPERPSESAPAPPDEPTQDPPPPTPASEPVVVPQPEPSIVVGPPENLPLHRGSGLQRPSPTVSDPGLPGCPVCGLLMVDEPRHARWHQEQKEALQGQDVAIFDEVTLRTLLGDVVHLALDEFQRGMQEYLEHQFAQVEARLITLNKRSSSSRPWAQGKGGKHS